MIKHCSRVTVSMVVRSGFQTIWLYTKEMNITYNMQMQDFLCNYYTYSKHNYQFI